MCAERVVRGRLRRARVGAEELRRPRRRLQRVALRLRLVADPCRCQVSCASVCTASTSSQICCGQSAFARRTRSAALFTSCGKRASASQIGRFRSVCPTGSPTASNWTVPASARRRRGCPRSSGSGRARAGRRAGRDLAEVVLERRLALVHDEPDAADEEDDESPELEPHATKIGNGERRGIALVEPCLGNRTTKERRDGEAERRSSWSSSSSPSSASSRRSARTARRTTRSSGSTSTTASPSFNTALRAREAEAPRARPARRR